MRITILRKGFYFVNGIESCSFRHASFFYVTNPPWKLPPHASDAHSILLLVTEGVLCVEMKSGKHEVKSGEFLLLPHDVSLIGYRISGSSTGFYQVLFDTPLSAASPEHFTVSNTTVVRDLFRQLVKSYRFPGYPRAGLNALMHTLFYEIQFQREPAVTPDDASLAARIKKYLNDSIDRNITVADAAAHFGYCTGYINRVFSGAEHISVKAYINQLKIQRIEEYLISTNTSIKMISKKLDFPNTDALSKFYKYHTGKTLTELRSEFVDS